MSETGLFMRTSVIQDPWCLLYIIKVMSAELLKSPIERAGRLKVLSMEVPLVSALSLISANKEVICMTHWKEAHIKAIQNCLSLYLYGSY